MQETEFPKWQISNKAPEGGWQAECLEARIKPHKAPRLKFTHTQSASAVFQNDVSHFRSLLGKKMRYKVISKINFKN